MIAAVETALGHYLEIAADARARRTAGTPALASALLVLGEHAGAPVDVTPVDGVLHMLGPDRIRHLVQPGTGRSGVAAAVVATSCVAGLAALAVTVYVPYLVTALTGCA